MTLHTIYSLMPILEVDYQVIWWAVTKGYIVPCNRVGRVWLFNDENLEQLKEYIGAKKAKKAQLAINRQCNEKRKFKKVK